MADSFIQVATDGSGKKMQTFQNLIGSDQVHAEAITLVDSTGVPITTLAVSAAVLPLPTGAATEASLAAILAKLIAAPATEAKQDALISANHTDLAAILAKIIAAPATAAKQPALGTALAPSVDVITVQRPAVTQIVSTAFEASHVLKNSAGQLVQLSIFNSKASAQFILLINATSVPSDGAVTLLFPPIPIAAATLLILDIPSPLVAGTGIVVCNSSTGTFTKTIGSADCAFYAQVN